MVDIRKNKLDRLMLLIRFVAKKVPRTVADFIFIYLKLIPYTYLIKGKTGILKSNVEEGESL
jgi:uncharacterized membrane protein YwzB